MGHFLHDREGTLLVGHRGHSVGGHENSRHALALAARHGATVCEIDVRLGADGVLVVFHDDLLDAASDGEGAVRALCRDTFGAIHHRVRGGAVTGEPLSCLEDMLDFARALPMNLIIELKDPLSDAQLERFCSLIADRSVADKVLVSSFDHPMLARLRQGAPWVETMGIVHARLLAPVAAAAALDCAAITLDYPASALAAAPTLLEHGIAASHLVRDPISYLGAGDVGRAELARVLDMIQSGALAMLFADDVGWGWRVRDATDVGALLAECSPACAP